MGGRIGSRPLPRTLFVRRPCARRPDLFGPLPSRLSVRRPDLEDSAFPGRPNGRFRDYRRAGGDGERSGWLAPDPGLLELPPASRGWHSTDFAAGDVAVFGMDLLHTTVPNTTRSFRLSCDTRWQPAAAPPPAGVTVGPWRREARLRAAAAAAARRPSEPASDGSPAPRAEVVGAAPGRMGPPGAEFDPPHRLAKRCCQSSSVASALWTAQAAADGRASAD
ncbi:unnamed protein product [Prorocentrum cordatum]|uniref:Uncharacterized protein n=1 Tax=Prorocentrum cordatum TaxID=2364126 RepID=A0ABN9V2K7_9DINO|nr:unnamed protein product [Polarella glacialis]